MCHFTNINWNFFPVVFWKWFYFYDIRNKRVTRINWFWQSNTIVWHIQYYQINYNLNNRLSFTIMYSNWIWQYPVRMFWSIQLFYHFNKTVIQCEIQMKFYCFYYKETAFICDVIKTGCILTDIFIRMQNVNM